jgi:hypothetical protein
MAPLNPGGRPLLSNAAGWLRWEGRRSGRRFLRRHGASGVLLLVCSLLLGLAWGLERQQAAALQARVRQPGASGTSDPSAETALPDAGARMRHFEATLLAHDELPSQVQDLINLAEAAHLSVSRGEYRPQVDAKGGFLRYRMNLPVRGDGQAVHDFIETALRTHPALGLESIQFQRPQIESVDIEARIQWVILARLPGMIGRPVSEGRP